MMDAGDTLSRGQAQPTEICFTVMLIRQGGNRELELMAVIQADNVTINVKFSEDSQG